MFVNQHQCCLVLLPMQTIAVGFSELCYKLFPVSKEAAHTNH